MSESFDQLRERAKVCHLMAQWDGVTDVLMGVEPGLILRLLAQLDGAERTISDAWESDPLLASRLFGEVLA